MKHNDEYLVRLSNDWNCLDGDVTEKGKYDGSGYYGTLTQISDIPVSCEAFYKDMERTDFEYVYWFNK